MIMNEFEQEKKLIKDFMEEIIPNFERNIKWTLERQEQKKALLLSFGLLVESSILSGKVDELAKVLLDCELKELKLYENLEEHFRKCIKEIETLSAKFDEEEVKADILQ